MISKLLQNGSDIGRQMSRVQKPHDLHWLLYCFTQLLKNMRPGAMVRFAIVSSFVL